MAQNKPNQPITSILNVSNEDFKNELSKRISLGEEFIDRNVVSKQEYDKLSEDYSFWNDYNSEYLKQSFNNTENEYRKSYVNAGYTFIGQMGEVANNPILTLKNFIKYRIDNLKSLLAKSVLIKSEISSDKTKAIFNPIKSDQTQVFIVHGRDDLAKTQVARYIEKLGFNPIILHEQSSSGKTIIEKIEEYTNVGFGIVLYTPCDIGTINGNTDFKPRARQNVVFEHGFLIGKIGRGNVCALVKSGIEIPNDISGVVYIKLDEDEAWHLKLAKELKSSGYDVDMNKL